MGDCNESSETGFLGGVDGEEDVSSEMPMENEVGGGVEAKPDLSISSLARLFAFFF